MARIKTPSTETVNRLRRLYVQYQLNGEDVNKKAAERLLVALADRFEVDREYDKFRGYGITFGDLGAATSDRRDEVIRWQMQVDALDTSKKLRYAIDRMYSARIASMEVVANATWRQAYLNHLDGAPFDIDTDTAVLAIDDVVTATETLRFRIRETRSEWLSALVAQDRYAGVGVFARLLRYADDILDGITDYDFDKMSTPRSDIRQYIGNRKWFRIEQHRTIADGVSEYTQRVTIKHYAAHILRQIASTVIRDGYHAYPVNCANTYPNAQRYEPSIMDRSSYLVDNETAIEYLVNICHNLRSIGLRYGYGMSSEDKSPSLDDRASWPVYVAVELNNFLRTKFYVSDNRALYAPVDVDRWDSDDFSVPVGVAWEVWAVIKSLSDNELLNNQTAEYRSLVVAGLLMLERIGTPKAINLLNELRNDLDNTLFIQKGGFIDDGYWEVRWYKIISVLVQSLPKELTFRSTWFNVNGRRHSGWAWFWR